MKPYKNIFVTGSMGYDVIMDFKDYFEHYFNKDKLHQINVSFVVDRLDKQIGGTGTNIAYGIAQLQQDVSLLASVGKDGDDILNHIKKAGVKTDGILWDKSQYSFMGQVITDLTGNQIWGVHYGACATGKDIDFGRYVSTDDVMIIPANHPDAFLKIQAFAIENRIDYMFDPGMTLTWNKPADLHEGVMHCRWLIGNDYEIAQIMKFLNTSVEALNEKGIVVITTLGDKGVQYNEKGAQYYVPSYQPKDVCDPTGAGDAWRGGFLYGVMNGKEVTDCLRLGNALASFAVASYGTANYTTTPEQVFERARNLEVQSQS